MEDTKLRTAWTNRRLLIIGCMIAGLLAGMASSAFAKGNQVFFRGGGAFLSEDRGGQIFTDTGGATGTFNNEDSGFYVGGGVELVLSNNVWGFMPKTTVLGEIGVEYRRFDSNRVVQVAGALASDLTNFPIEKVQLTMLNVSVSPKIKFNEGSPLRPWIIPVRVGFHRDQSPVERYHVFGRGGPVRRWVGVQHLWPLQRRRRRALPFIRTAHGHQQRRDDGGGVRRNRLLRNERFVLGQCMRLAPPGRNATPY